MKIYDLIVIGGGPAGLAAAIAAHKEGLSNILILERDNELGGILNQCIHNGFGLHTFKEELTGPEYADRFIRQVQDLRIPCKLKTMVLDIQIADTPAADRHTGSAASASDAALKVVTAINSTDGLLQLFTRTVILAMGCRERPRGALHIPGFRPAGIYTAGTAQRLVNMEGYMPGKDVVILGSGDIGLIMARRMTLEGARVHAVAELMPYSGGLQRNIVQCLEDFSIPLKLSHTVVDIKGKDRVRSVTLAQVGPDRKPIPGTEEEICCDTLLLSCGLLPENELSEKLGVALSSVTNGPLVNESLETNVPGVFACGNVLHVHDLVDYVSEEADRAGRCAARYVKEIIAKAPAAVLSHPAADLDAAGLAPTDNSCPAPELSLRLLPQAGVRYTVPQSVRPGRMEDLLLIRFRTDAVYTNCYVCVYLGDTCLLRQKKNKLAPGEMQQFILRKQQLTEALRLNEHSTLQAQHAQHAQPMQTVAECAPVITVGITSAS